MWYTRSRRRRRTIISFLIILVLIIALISLTFIYLQFQVPITTEGFIPMQVDRIITVGNNAVVQLKGKCSEMGIYVSPSQAIAISEGTFNKTPFRPSTHDIIVDILGGYGITPIMIKITRLEESTYFAELILQKWNQMLILDIRPSDAMATAVRTNTAIFVNESLVTKTC